MPAHRCGWIPHYPDGLDAGYRIQSVMPQLEAGRTTPSTHHRVRAYKDGPLLDQDGLPQCVAYAARGTLDGAPIMTPPSEGPTPQILYDLARDLDEIPGLNYQGTTVHGGMRALLQLGYISAYLWAQTQAEAVDFLENDHGTLQAGTDWYPQMDEVDRNGYMQEPARAGSTPIDGHSYRITWYDRKRDAFLMRNSWGPLFGWLLPDGTRSGYAWMRAPFLFWLVGSRWAELGGATQVRIKPVKA